MAAQRRAGPTGPGPVLLLADARPLTATIVQMVSRGRSAPVRRQHIILSALAAALRARDNNDNTRDSNNCDNSAAGNTAAGNSAASKSAANNSSSNNRSSGPLRVAFLGTLSGDAEGPYAEFVAACDARLDGYLARAVRVYLKPLDADDRAFLLASADIIAVGGRALQYTKFSFQLNF